MKEPVRAGSWEDSQQTWGRLSGNSFLPQLRFFPKLLLFGLPKACQPDGPEGETTMARRRPGQAS